MVDEPAVPWGIATIGLPDAGICEAATVVREMKACHNGARRLGEHPDLPLTADELGRAAAAAVTTTKRK